MPTADWDVVSTEPLESDSTPPSSDGWSVVSSKPLPAPTSADGWNVVASKPLPNPYAGIGTTESPSPSSGVAVSAAAQEATHSASAAQTPPTGNVYNQSPTQYGRNAKGALTSRWDGTQWVDLFTGKPTGAPASHETVQPKTSSSFAPDEPDEIPGQPGSAHFTAGAKIWNVNDLPRTQGSPVWIDGKQITFDGLDANGQVLAHAAGSSPESFGVSHAAFEPISSPVGSNTYIPIDVSGKPPLVPAPQGPFTPTQILPDEPAPQPRPAHDTPQTAIMTGASQPVPQYSGIAQAKPSPNDPTQALLDVRDLLLGPAFGAKLKSDSGVESILNAFVRASAGLNTPEGVALMIGTAGLGDAAAALRESPKFLAAVSAYPNLAKGIDLALRAGPSALIAASAGVPGAYQLGHGIHTGNMDEVGQGLASLSIAGLAGTHAFLTGKDILTAEQQALLKVLSPGGDPETPDARSELIQKLQTQVDRGGTAGERFNAQQLLKKLFGVSYGDAVDLTPQGTNPSEPAAPVAQPPIQTFNPEDVDAAPPTAENQTSPPSPAESTATPATENPPSATTENQPSGSQEVIPGATFTDTEGKQLTVKRILNSGQVVFSGNGSLSKMPLADFRTLVGLNSQVPPQPAEAAPAAPAPAPSPSPVPPTTDELPQVAGAGTQPEEVPPPVPGKDVIQPAPSPTDQGTGVEAPQENKPEEKPDYDFASTQANLPAELADNVRTAAAAIPDDQLAEKGHEDQPHATVLYGLPHTDTHPVYVPHVTVAYLQKGQGEQYDGKDIPGVTGQTVTLDSVAFSDKGGKQTEIPLTGRSPESQTAVTPGEQTSPATETQLPFEELQGIDGVSWIASEPFEDGGRYRAEVFPHQSDGDWHWTYTETDEMGRPTRQEEGSAPTRQAAQEAASKESGLLDELLLPKISPLPEGVSQETYDQAVSHVREIGKASTSTLQRKFRMGYGTATAVLNRMEQDGIVGSAKGSAPREVLAPALQPEAIKAEPDPRLAQIEAHNQKAADLMAQARKVNPRDRAPLLDQAQKELAAGKALKAEMEAPSAVTPQSAGLPSASAAPVSPSTPQSSPVGSPVPPKAPAIDRGAIQSLRKTADGMQSQIDAKLNPGSANQNPTARRARIAGGMIAEGQRMERVQKGLRTLAELHESGSVPPILKEIRSRSAFEDLMPRYDEAGKRLPSRFPVAYIHNSYIRDFNEKLKGKPGTKDALSLLNRRNTGDGVHLRGTDEIGLISGLVNKAESAGISTAKYAKDSLARARRLYTAGINEDNFAVAQQAIEDLGVKKSALTQEQKIKAAERDLIGTKIEGYFPTPKPLAERLVAEADIKPGMSVLEPSAGSGAIADAISQTGAKVYVIEPAQRLRDILTLKGHKLVARDFTTFQGMSEIEAGAKANEEIPEAPPTQYDRVVMNPPFERGQDVDHVRHAFDLLKPGGKLVAIMGEHAFFANDARSREFRSWLDQNGATVQKLPEGSFTGKEAQRQTGVAARVVTIDKPTTETKPAAAFREADHGVSPKPNALHGSPLPGGGEGTPGGPEPDISGYRSANGPPHDRQSRTPAQQADSFGAVQEKTPKQKLAQAYLTEPVTYGGQQVTRGEMIADLQSKGATQEQINAYLGGRDTASAVAESSPGLVRAYLESGQKRLRSLSPTSKEFADLLSELEEYSASTNLQTPSNYELAHAITRDAHIRRNAASAEAARADAAKKPKPEAPPVETNAAGVNYGKVHSVNRKQEFTVVGVKDDGSPVGEYVTVKQGREAGLWFVEREYYKTPPGPENRYGNREKVKIGGEYSKREAMQVAEAYLKGEPNPFAPAENGLPISEYKPSKTPKIENERAPGGFLHNTADGQDVWSNGHVAFTGKAPGELSKADKQPQVQVVWNGAKKDAKRTFQAIGFYRSHGTTRIVFTDNAGHVTSLDSNYFDFARQRFPDATFRGDTNKQALTVWQPQKGGTPKMVGIIMPLRVEAGDLPPGINALLPGGPSSLESRVLQMAPRNEWQRATQLQRELDANQSEYNRLEPIYRSLQAQSSERGYENLGPAAQEHYDKMGARLDELRSSIDDLQDRIHEVLEKADPNEAAALESRISPGFYSQLERTVEAKMPARANPAQVKGILDNPQNGVKPDERKWTGIDTWLEEQKGSVSKQQVLDFIRQNAVQVHEVVRGRDVDQEKVAELQSKLAQAIEAAKSQEGTKFKAGDRVATVGSAPSRGGYQYSEGRVYEAQPNKQGLLVWKKVDTFGGERSGRSEKFIRELKAEAKHPWLDGVRSNDHVTDSQGAKAAQSRVYQLEAELAYAKEGTGEPTKFQKYKLPGGQNYRELLLTLPKNTPGYQSPHWDEPNVVAHLRMSDYVTTGGQKVAVMQEDQSDWHEAGRKKGYAPSGAERARLQQAYESAKTAYAEAVNRLADLKRFENAGLTVREFAAASSDVYRTRDAMELARNQLHDGISAAPFSKSWHELVFRRALRDAVERGMDKFAWTTGAQQAALYNLSRQVDSIHYSPEEKRFWAVKDGHDVVNKEIEPGEVSDYVGKELADRLLKSPVDEGTYDRRTLSGKGLTVGGEGMKGFYDQILPQYAAKYVKKWGATVGTVKLPRISGELHSIDITPAMRESVMQGQPLFALKGTGEQPASKETADIPRVPDSPIPPDAFNLAAIKSYWTGAQSQATTLEGTPVLLVNNAGMDIVLNRMGQIGSGMDPEHTVGLALRPYEWRNILAEAKAAAKSPRAGGFDHALVKLASELTKATENHDGPVVILQTGESIPEDRLQTVAQEELDHAKQLKLPAGLGAQPVRLLAGELGRAAQNGLLRLGYKEPNPNSPWFENDRAVMMAEIGVRLMRGRYNELNLTAQQARDLANQYAAALIRDFGDKANEVVDIIYGTYPKIEELGSQDLATQRTPDRQSGPRGREQLPSESAGVDLPGNQAEPGSAQPTGIARTGAVPVQGTSSASGNAAASVRSGSGQLNAVATGSAAATTSGRSAAPGASGVGVGEYGSAPEVPETLRGRHRGGPTQPGTGAGGLRPRRGDGGGEVPEPNAASYQIANRTNSDIEYGNNGAREDGSNDPLRSGGTGLGTPASLESRATPAPLQKRLTDAAALVSSLPDDQIPQAMQGDIGALLKQIQGTRGVEDGIFDYARGLVDDGEPQAWREDVAGYFKRAALVIQAEATARTNARRNAAKAAAPIVDSTGTPILRQLRNWFKSINPDGSKSNYSGLGAFESKFVRNLGQTAEADPNVYRAALLAATPKAQAAVAIATAHPAMKAELGKSGLSLADFYLWGARDRLMGLRDRWNSFGDQAETMTSPEEIKEAMDDEYFGGLLQKIAGKRHIAQDVFQTSVAAVQQEDWDAWRTFVAQTFRDAGEAVEDSIQEMMPDTLYDQRASDPHFQEALRVYRDRIADPMAQDHEQNDGVFSTALGPSKTYFPLIPATRSLVSGPGRRIPWRKPRNQFNQFATGLSTEYLTTPEALKNRLVSGLRANTKAALIKATDDAGLSIPPSAVDQDGNVTWRGVKYPASPPEEVSPARTIIQNDKVIHIRATMRVFPNWFHAEMKPILEGKKLDESEFGKMSKILMAVTLSGPAEAAFHMANLTGAMISNTPFLGTSLTDKAISVPLAKRFAVIGKVIFTDPTTAQAARDLQDMAKLGIIPSRYGSVTYSKKYAEELGAERKALTLSPLLFGPEGFDVRARLLMYRIGMALAAERGSQATPYELNTFVNQLGNYTSQLQGNVERTVKSWPFAQFFTAGSTMIRNGLNSITATSPVPGGNTAKLLAWKLLTGMVGTVALWVALHELLSGSLPWKDRRSKFLSFPVGGERGWLNEKVRRSWIGSRWWGDGPEIGYIGMGFFNPLVTRAGRAVGVADAYNTAIRGGTFGQDFEGAERDLLNTWASPLLGPPLRFATVAALGVEPYLADFRSRSGTIEPHAIAAIPPNARPGLPTLARKAAAATVGLNAFYNNLGEATGLSTGVPLHGAMWLRMTTDLVTPGLFQGSSDPEAQAKVIQEQQSVYRRPEQGNDQKQPAAHGKWPLPKTSPHGQSIRF